MDCLWSMLNWIDRHCLYFYRVMSKRTVLYTEMVTTGAILYGKGNYLAYNEQEHPLVLLWYQLLDHHFTDVDCVRRGIARAK